MKKYLVVIFLFCFYTGVAQTGLLYVIDANTQEIVSFKDLVSTEKPTLVFFWFASGRPNQYAISELAKKVPEWEKKADFKFFTIAIAEGGSVMHKSDTATTLDDYTATEEQKLTMKLVNANAYKPKTYFTIDYSLLELITGSSITPAFVIFDKTQKVNLIKGGNYPGTYEELENKLVSISPKKAEPKPPIYYDVRKSQMVYPAIYGGCITITWSINNPNCIALIKQVNKQLEHWQKKYKVYVSLTSIDDLSESEKIYTFLKKNSIDFDCYIDTGSPFKKVLDENKDRIPFVTLAAEKGIFTIANQYSKDIPDLIYQYIQKYSDKR